MVVGEEESILARLHHVTLRKAKLLCIVHYALKGPKCGTLSRNVHQQRKGEQMASIFRGRLLGVLPDLNLPWLPRVDCNTKIIDMDQASKVLAQASLHEPTTWAALSDASGVPLTTLYNRAHGRRSKEAKAQSQQYLTVEEEKALVAFILLMHSFGQPVRIKYIPTLAFSIARRRLANRRNKSPGKNWVQAFQKRHPEIISRRVRSIDWRRHDINIYQKVTEWFDVVSKVLNSHAVLPENIYNMDETGVMLSMLGSAKVLIGKSDSRYYRGAGVKRTMVTAIECISADGRSLSPLIIWPASTHRSNWTTYPTPGWHYGVSENGYNDSKISLEWITRVFDVQIKERANGNPRVLICDGFGTHETLEILEFCFENNIILCRLPYHTSHKLQPCDVSVFGPLKSAYRDQVERLNRGGIDTIGKEHFTYLYDPARTKAITTQNIAAGWEATGLYPFNPERVLQGIAKPPPELSISNTDQAGTSGEGLPPITLVTPVTVEGLTLLHDLIERATQPSDTTGEQRLNRRVQKLVRAAKTAVIRQRLLQDHNRLLFNINKEGEQRRKTRPIILQGGKGQGKVISYEDLETARAERAAKERAAAEKGKGKRGGKSKNASQTEEEEAETSMPGHRVRCNMQEQSFTPYQIPVARMY